MEATPSGQWPSVVAGQNVNCGLKSDQAIVCWGNIRDFWNAFDLLEMGSVPAKFESQGKFTHVSLNGANPCGLKTDGTLACWGLDNAGETRPPSGRFTAVASGGNYACGIRSDSTLTCWGGTEDGGTDPPSGIFSTVAAKLQNACAIGIDKTISCWGMGIFRADGTYEEGGSTFTRWVSVDPPSGTYSEVSVGGGGGYACALRTAGTLVCWGESGWGAENPPSGVFTSVSAGDTHACGIRANGTIACWGDSQHDATRVPAGKWNAVSAGFHSNCALSTHGTITCWGGGNQYGQNDVPS